MNVPPTTASRVVNGTHSTATPAPTGGPGDHVGDNIKEAVTAKNETVGGLIQSLDNFAISAGNWRISLWDVMIVVVVIILVIVMAHILRKLTFATLKRIPGLDQAQQVLLEKISSLLIWGIAILIGIDILGINLTALAFFSGAFGLAIGFGLQKTFGNLIAGIILLMDKSIKPGDVIAITDQAGTSTFGQIRKIGIRAVSITTRDQREYLIPNETLMVNQVENWSYSSRNVRIHVDVGISYDADIAKAEELMLEAAQSVERVLKGPPPSVWLENFGENAINFTIQCWINDPEDGLGNVRSDILKKLWWLFKDNGIEIPFPQRDVNLKASREFQELIESLRMNQSKGDQS